MQPTLGAPQNKYPVSYGFANSQKYSMQVQK
jgi:hypothetical protein